MINREFENVAKTLLRRGTNQREMRAYNEKIVLSLLRRHGPMAKAEIAKITQLSAQTISVIMRELENDGLLLKGNPVRGKVGQPSVPMSLDPDGAYFFGIKIGRRSTEILLINFLGECLGKDRLVYDLPVIDDVMSFIRNAIEGLPSSIVGVDTSRILGAGLTMPFDIWSWEEEVEVHQQKMRQWREYNVVEALRQITHYPIYMENDASAACAAELYFGNEVRPSQFLYFYMGYFLGGGVVLNDQLFTGSSGNAGALGSMIVLDENRNLVQLLEMGSLASLDKELRSKGYDNGMLWQDVQEWEVPNEVLQGWLNRSANGIAQAVIEATAVIDFDAVVIDGWMPPSMRKELTEKTTRALGCFKMRGLREPTIYEGRIGGWARSLGAASLPMSDQFMAV